MIWSGIYSSCTCSLPAQELNWGLGGDPSINPEDTIINCPSMAVWGSDAWIQFKAAVMNGCLIICAKKMLLQGIFVGWQGVIHVFGSLIESCPAGIILMLQIFAPICWSSLRQHHTSSQFGGRIQQINGFPQHQFDGPHFPFPWKEEKLLREGM